MYSSIKHTAATAIGSVNPSHSGPRSNVIERVFPPPISRTGASLLDTV